VIQGTALALFDNDGLDRLTERRYLRSHASYENRQYVESGLFVWEQQAVDTYFSKGGRVLVAAAGAGREMIALSLRLQCKRIRLLSTFSTRTDSFRDE